MQTYRAIFTFIGRDRPPEVALRMLLKRLLRQHGFRCDEVLGADSQRPGKAANRLQSRKRRGCKSRDAGLPGKQTPDDSLSAGVK